MSATAEAELTRFLGPLGKPLFTRVFRYEKGTPQPELGYQKLLERIHSAVETIPGVSLIGSGHGGAGIPDCIRQANECVQALCERRSAVE